MDLTISKADANDISYILQIENELEHHILSKDMIAKDITSPNYFYLVAKDNNKPVAFLVLELMVDHADVIAIAVSKNYRRKRVATSLLHKAEEMLKAENIFKIFLEVRVSNLSAISLYENCGYTKLWERKNYYPDNHETAYIYLKLLE